jgi:hypothetical protein
MRKVLVGLVVALIVGVGGYFGAAYWAQYAAAREVEAVLDGWRAGVGSATHGRIEFDLWTRTLKVHDVVVQSRTGPHPKIALGQIVASGIDFSGKAASLDLVDLEVSDALPGQPGGRIDQKAPRVTLKGFSSRRLAPRKVASMFDMTRLWLEQFSAIAAASIEVPSLTVTVSPGPTAGVGRSPALSAEYTYANLNMRDVRDGRVAEATVDGVVLRGSGGAPLHDFKGEIGKSTILDADVGPLLAFLDAARPRSHEYQRVYRQLSAGPYTLRMSNGATVSVDAILAEDIGLRPAKLSLDDIVFLSEVASPPGAVRSPAQLTMLLDKFAGLYEGIHVGRLELQGFSVVSNMRNDFRMASLRIDRLDNGRFGELSLEGLNGKPAIGNPFNMGRVAVRGLDIANIMRVASTQLAVPPGQPPTAEKISAMLALVEGVEVRNVAIPEPKTGRTMQLDAFNASWGRFVGGIPSQARISMKFTAPIGPLDPEPFIKMLVGAGIRALAAGVEFGTHWTEATRTVALEPANLEIGGVFALSLKASAGNVPRDIFSTDPVRVMASAVMVDAGPIELSLRDLGLVDLLAAETARTRGAGPEMGRTLILENIARNRQALAHLGPDVETLFRAVERFVQGKGETLTVRLTPRGRVGLLQFLDASKVDPVAAMLTSFNVEATGGR